MKAMKWIAPLATLVLFSILLSGCPGKSMQHGSLIGGEDAVRQAVQLSAGEVVR